ncbi:MAG: ABC transporter permease [Planctomycetota bacterium]
MIKTIAFYEFMFTIKRKSYYLVTLGMPLIALAYFGLIALIVMASVPSQLEKMKQPVGMIDHSGLLTSEGGPLSDIEAGETIDIEVDDPTEIPELEDLPVPTEQMEFLRVHPVMYFDDLAAAQKALEEETIRQVTVIPEDYLEEGRFQVYVVKSQLLDTTMDTGWISKLIANRVLERTDLQPAEIARIQKFSSSTEFEIGEDGTFVEVNKLSKGFSMGIPLAVAGLLIIALMMNSSLLITSIAEEKENKVMEVIVSSVSADTLLFGKVMGIVLAGLLQILIWMLMVSIVPAMSMAAMSQVIEYQVNWFQLGIGCVFVLLGFVFYGCLLAGMGSLGSSYKDCQQLSVAVILCACVPMMAPMVFISNPNGTVAQVLSMIPLFSPVSMMMRLGVDKVPMWEVAVSFVILLVSIYFAIKLAARLFRAGTLMQGKRPGIKEIWKVLTQPA